MKKTAVTQPASSLELSSERQIVRTTRLIGVALFTSIDFLVPVASGKEKNQLEAEEPASIVAMTNCRRLIEVKDSFGVAEAILETAGPGEVCCRLHGLFFDHLVQTREYSCQVVGTCPTSQREQFFTFYLPSISKNLESD